MVYLINEDCIKCGACADVCPAECIHGGDAVYVIDQEECISCGSCADVCPVDAPQPED